MLPRGVPKKKLNLFKRIIGPFHMIVAGRGKDWGWVIRFGANREELLRSSQSFQSPEESQANCERELRSYVIAIHNTVIEETAYWKLVE